MTSMVFVGPKGTQGESLREWVNAAAYADQLPATAVPQRNSAEASAQRPSPSSRVSDQETNLLADAYFAWSEYQEKVTGRPRGRGAPSGAQPGRGADADEDVQPLLTSPE